MFSNQSFLTNNQSFLIENNNFCLIEKQKVSHQLKLLKILTDSDLDFNYTLILILNDSELK